MHAIRFSISHTCRSSTSACHTVSGPKPAPRRDTKGLYRVHQFTKVEMFAFCTPEESDRFIWNCWPSRRASSRAGLPYHVIDTCTGDLGGPAYRKYDLEAWMPGRPGGEYGEVTSTSNCTDYQARRLNIRYKAPDRRAHALCIL